MKQDMVHLINQMDDSSEQQVKTMWLYLRQIIRQEEKGYSPEIKSRMAEVEELYGAFSACQTVDWKKDKEEYLLEKYGE